MVRYIAFGVVTDDIAFKDGRQFLGVLGGGGPQAAFGMRLWSDDVGLLAVVGPDWPDEHRALLQRIGVDLRGVITGDGPTLRAWQVYDDRGTRRQMWEIAPEGGRPSWDAVLARAPEDYRSARGYHVGVHPEAPDFDFVRQLQDRGGQVSLELFRPAAQPISREALRALVSTPTILSLNLDEARSVCGEGELRAAIRCLRDAGAGTLAVRLGADGAIVASTQPAHCWHIPAFPATVADPTGAGNAFGGAFVGGYVETGDVLTAGLWGSVAASLLVEHVGLPPLDPAVRTEAARRLKSLRSQARRVDLL
jgi:sugar/nucleoside kinase (ribokinase family)